MGFVHLHPGTRRQHPLSDEELRPLSDVCHLISEVSGVPLGPQHPVVGSGIFDCESGIHVHGLLRLPSTYEPYQPELAGHARRIVMGAKSGKAAVAFKAEEALTGTEFEALAAPFIEEGNE